MLVARHAEMEEAGALLPAMYASLANSVAYSIGGAEEEEEAFRCMFHGGTIVTSGGRTYGEEERQEEEVSGEETYTVPLGLIWRVYGVE